MKYYRNNSRLWAIFLIVSLVVFCSDKNSIAQDYLQQQVAELDARVISLEEYLEKLPQVLGDYSESILNNVDRKIEVNSGRVVSLNLVSQEFSKVSTNVGTFLVAINKREKTKNRCVLYLHIGNPNAATYRGAEMKIRWGSKWDPDSVKQSYKEWRKTLVGYEYNYSGTLKPGQWTEIAVELVPVDENFGYVEFEMDINSIELIELKNN